MDTPFARLLKAERRPRDLKEARDLARGIVDSPGRNYVLLQAALAAFALSPAIDEAVVARWKALGRSPFRQFAPYAAYIFEVEVFFQLAVASDLISPDRPSNRVDLAYLFYLPFCEAFTSMDKLHRKMVPLFMRPNQIFVWAADLKEDLGSLDNMLNALPEEEKANGLLRLARIPANRKFLIARVCDHVMPGWDVPQNDKRASALDVDADRALVKHLQGLTRLPRTDAQRLPPHILQNPDMVLIERHVPVQLGKWRLLPAGVENAKSEDSAQL